MPLVSQFLCRGTEYNFSNRTTVLLDRVVRESVARVLKPRDGCLSLWLYIALLMP